MTSDIDAAIDRLDQCLDIIHPQRFSRSLLAWYDAHRVDHPWRSAWREREDPYVVWVSEVMLQQTLIAAVTPRYLDFLAHFPTVHALASATEDDLRPLLRGLGYYRRFRFLHEGAKAIAANSPPKWPTTFAGWKELSGVGDYIAAAVSSIAFDCPHAVVDGNVERVFCRLFDLRLPTNHPGLKKPIQKASNLLLDKSRPGDFNQAVMELGQRICTVKKPLCSVCPVQSQCLAYQHESMDEAPQAKIKKLATSVDLRITLVKKRGKVGLLSRSPQAKFLKNSVGFATEIAEKTKTGFRYCIDGNKRQRVKASVHLGSFRHSITHHRIKAEVFLGKTDDLWQSAQVEWVNPQEIEGRLSNHLDWKAWQVYQKSL